MIDDEELQELRKSTNEVLRALYAIPPNPTEEHVEILKDYIAGVKEARLLYEKRLTEVDLLLSVAQEILDKGSL